ncbi:hypothetical protein M422DRAFT_68362 [Sphaerobolus stellatus SS14]|uniref:Unplaced genomic scaffold SPHSTscaffold_64, whole genome shotgun sequence n=1 Tax=Sphaerobolus stellatus (strain SS14) TaxID=990650 RepID=A0A0C9VRS1_SPHS4|nr:hypothetical protein M422DRAFT_68362 [Sphaerobolus stellatus SS14]
MPQNEPDLGSDEAVRRLLDTRFTPNYLQTNSLKEIIENREQQRSKLDEEISSLVLRLAQLSGEWQKVNNSLNNATVTEMPYLYKWRSPPVLLRVCKSWRRIALTTPELFTRLHFDRHCHFNPISLVSLYLNHSGILPLDISLSPELWHAWPEYVKGVFDMIKYHAHRISKLKISSSSPLYFFMLFPKGHDHHLPILRQLDIELRLNRGEDVGTTRIFMPNITEFNINTFFEWQNIFVVGNSLRRFGASDRPSEAGSQQLLALLRGCPNLEACYLHFEDNSFDNIFQESSSSEINLPKLSEFQLLWCQETAKLREILPRLRTPNIESLTIKADYFSELLNIIPAVSSWLHAGSVVHLRKLILSSVLVLADQLHTLLAGLPYLQDLTLGLTTITDDSMAVLNRDINPDVCPALLRLTLTDSIHALHAVVGTLISRLKSSSPSNLGELEFLREFHAIRGSWRDSTANDRGIDEKEAKSVIEDIAKRYSKLKVDIELRGVEEEVFGHGWGGGGGDWGVWDDGIEDEDNAY